MKILFPLVLLLLSACAGGVDVSSLPRELPGTAKQEYIVGTEDVPLYFGFVQTEDGNVSYDSVDGRIIDASFESVSVRANNVRNFYDSALPQLGWHKLQYQLYEREGETLRLNVISKNGKTLLKFSIRPSS